MKKTFHKRSGFSLVELLVVISVIAILAVLVIINLESARARTRDAQRKSDLTKISTGLESYKVENKVYPMTGYNGGVYVDLYSDSTLGVLTTDNYLQSIPDDPLRTATSSTYTYKYSSSSIGSDYKLIALSETITDDDIKIGAANCQVSSVSDPGTCCSSQTPLLNKKAESFCDPHSAKRFQISSHNAAREQW